MESAQELLSRMIAEKEGQLAVIQRPRRLRKLLPMEGDVSLLPMPRKDLATKEQIAKSYDDTFKRELSKRGEYASRSSRRGAATKRREEAAVLAEDARLRVAIDEQDALSRRLAALSLSKKRGRPRKVVAKLNVSKYIAESPYLPPQEVVEVSRPRSPLAIRARGIKKPRAKKAVVHKREKRRPGLVGPASGGVPTDLQITIGRERVVKQKATGRRVKLAADQAWDLRFKGPVTVLDPYIETIINKRGIPMRLLRGISSETGIQVTKILPRI